MRLKTFFWLLASGFWFLAVECAQIVPPTGGKVDDIPPMVEKYIPDSAAINFNTKNITIVFDEYIQLADLQREMTVSPPMKYQPEVKVKGKILQVELRDTLKPNTTYVINFGSAIKDFHEGKTKTDFRYIFSTGDHIDTLRLTGTVKAAYDQKTEKGILVMLYESLDDSVPYKKGPSYFAKTNADGTYKISNIKPGKYKAFALKDGNSNYLYDMPTEQIGFSDTLINIKKNTKLDLQMFVEQPKKQKLLKSMTSGYGQMMLFYAKPVDTLVYKPLNSTTKTETFLTEYNPTRDSIRIWFPVFTKDTLYFKAIANKDILDTIRVSTGQFKKETPGRGEGFKLTAKINTSKDKPFELNGPLRIEFNHPVKRYNEKEVILKKNKEMIPSSLVSPDKSIQRIFFVDDFNPDSPKKDSSGRPVYGPDRVILDTGSYSLFIPPKTFTDIFDLKNDTVLLDFKTQEEKYYGTLKLALKYKIKITYILELLNEKGQVFSYKSSDKNVFSYEYLPPGNYKLRIIYDQDGNGKWSTGDYLGKRKPETIIYYPGPVTIRSNWDLELDWKIE